MGRAIFTMVGAMTEIERDIIISRVIAGLERAKERGVRLGRPALPQNAVLEIQKLRKKDSLSKIAGQVKLSAGAVARYT